MKHAISMLALLMGASGLFSQAQKGGVLFGASANLLGGLNFPELNSAPSQAGFAFGKTTEAYEFGGTTTQTTTKTKAFNFSPNCAYFVADGLAIGASLGLSRFSEKRDDQDPDTYTNLAFAPYLRRYFSGGNKVRPFFELSGGVLNSKRDFSNPQTDPHKDTFGFFTAKLGTAVFANDRVSFDAMVDFAYLRDKDGSGSDKSTDTQRNLGIGLGFSYFLK